MLTSLFVGGFSSIKSLKILICVSLEAEPGPCSKAALLFLSCSSGVSASSPFPISNCSNLPFGTREGHRGWSQTRNGRQGKASVPWIPAGSCSVS